MTHQELRCRDFVELASDYLEGSLSTDQRLVVELHLAFCSPCGDYLDQMRATVAATGQLRDDDVPQPVMDALVLAFRELRESSD